MRFITVDNVLRILASLLTFTLCSELICKIAADHPEMAWEQLLLNCWPYYLLIALGFLGAGLVFTKPTAAAEADCEAFWHW
jgi:hypothetical protein